MKAVEDARVVAPAGLPHASADLVGHTSPAATGQDVVAGRTPVVRVLGLHRVPAHIARHPLRLAHGDADVGRYGFHGAIVSRGSDYISDTGGR